MKMSSLSVKVHSTIFKYKGFFAGGGGALDLKTDFVFLYFCERVSCRNESLFSSINHPLAFRLALKTLHSLGSIGN